MSRQRQTQRSPGVKFVRVYLPVGLVLAAVVVAIVGPRELAPGLVAAAGFVVVTDWMIRFAISSQDDRDDEQRARSRFRRSGRWPEDLGPDDDPRDPPPSDSRSDPRNARSDPRDPHRHGRR